jgi:hypothetical protein
MTTCCSMADNLGISEHLVVVSLARGIRIVLSGQVFAFRVQKHVMFMMNRSNFNPTMHGSQFASQSSPISYQLSLSISFYTCLQIGCFDRPILHWWSAQKHDSE